MTSTSPLSVMVVDDDRMCRRILEVLLKQNNHHVDLAESAQKAMKLILKNRYDIIFLDIGLPNVSGIELAKTIRYEYKRDSLLVATTGHVLLEDKNRYHCAGIDIILEKPIDSDALENLLSRVADGKAVTS